MLLLLAEMPNTSPSLMRVGLSFIGLMLVLGLVIWLLKKMAGSRLGFFQNDSNIKVIERKALSPKTVVYIVAFENRKILIAESSQQLKMHELEEPIN